MSRTLALAAVLLGGACAQQAAAAQATPQYVQGESLMAPATPGNSSSPTAITCSSADTCVVAGYQYDIANDYYGATGLITSGTPGTFMPIPSLPADAGSAIQETLGTIYNNNGAISCPTASSCLAVGSYDDPTTTTHGLLTAISGGGAPSAGMGISLPAGAAASHQSGLFDLSCWSAGSCAAVGYYYGPGQYEGLVVPVTGGAPEAGVEVQPPVGAAADGSGAVQLTRVACWGTGSCVATGYYIDTAGNYQTLLVPITDGVPGTAVKVPMPAGAAASQSSEGNIESLTCTANGACVGVGSYSDASSYDEPLVIAIDNGALSSVSKVTLPAGAASSSDAYLNGVSCTPSGDCEAVGSYGDSTGNQQALVVPIVNGAPAAGIEVPAPENPPAGTSQQGELNDVSCIADGVCVAAGDYENSSAQIQGMTVALNGSTVAAALAAPIPSGAISSGGQAYAPLAEIACTSSGACDAVGNYEDSSYMDHAYVVDLQRALEVGTTSLAAATVDSPYSTTLAASGAWGSYSWSVSSGSLPNGLSLDPQTGVISGTPTAAGTATFTVLATGAGVPVQTASEQLSLTVAGKATTTTTTTTPTTPPVTTAVVVRAKVRVLHAGGRLKDGASGVRLSCAGATCHGTVKIRATETLIIKHGKRRVRRHRTVVIGTARFITAAGHTRSVAVHLNGIGRRLLAHAGHHRLAVEVVAAAAGGNRTMRRATIWALVKKHPRHRKR